MGQVPAPEPFPFAMPSTASEWDEKHRRDADAGSQDAAPILCELNPLLPPGQSLDLACGRGGNAIFLAEQGRSVTAVDWSTAALEILERDARSRGVTVKRLGGKGPSVHPPSGIAAICADLESFEFQAEEYSLVVCIRYLDRKLLNRIPQMLTPGGMALVETYTTAQLSFHGGPRNPAYLLHPGELRHALPGLKLVFYRELRAGQGIATLLAAKPA